MSDPRRQTSHHGGEDENPSPYPTYRDGPVPPHEATTTKPTDVGLPLRKRTYAWPALAAIVVVSAIGIALVAWGAVIVVTKDEPQLAPFEPSVSGDDTSPVETVQPRAEGDEIGPEPSAIDVPG